MTRIGKVVQLARINKLTSHVRFHKTAVSPFTPQQNGEGSAICTEEMETYFLLKQAACSAERLLVCGLILLSDTACSTSSVCHSCPVFLSLIYSLTFRCTTSFSAILGHLSSHTSITTSRQHALYITTINVCDLLD